MLDFFYDLVGGWTEVRNTQGISYQVSRSGKRRAVPIEDYGRNGEVDHQWLLTGEFTDEAFRRQFKTNRFSKSRKRVAQLVMA